MTGSETLTGGDGSDTFIYQEGDGTIIIDYFDTSLDKIRVLSGDVGTSFADTDGNVTFAVGDGQIIVKGGSDKYIQLYDKNGSELSQRYEPKNCGKSLNRYNYVKRALTLRKVFVIIAAFKERCPSGLRSRS